MKKKYLFSLITGALTGISIYNYLTNTSAFAKFPLPQNNSNIYHWKYGNIYYSKHGNGSPILLIHDLIACGSDFEWMNLVEKLSDKHTVYTIDLLGCARSEKPEMTYTNFLFTQLITDFLKDIIQQKTDLITSGNSASIAIMSSLHDCTYIDGLILINPPSIKTHGNTILPDKKLYWSLFHLPIIGTFLTNLKNNRRHLDELFQTEYFYNTELVSDFYIDAYHSAFHYHKKTSRSLYASIYTRLTNFDVSRALSLIHNRIYLIGGEFETNIDEIIKEYQKAYPSIQYDYIEDSKHLPQLEQCDKLFYAVSQWLAKN